MWLWLALGAGGLYLLTRKPSPASTTTDGTQTPPPDTQTPPPAGPSVVIDKTGGQVYVPPAGVDTDKLLKELMLQYARVDEPERVTEGPLKGIVVISYMLATPQLPKVTEAGEAAAFVRAGMMLNNPNAEPIVMIFEKSILDEVYAGKRPDRINIGLAPSSLAAKVAAPGSPYVMVGMKPKI